MKYSENVIEEIKSKLRLSEVIGSYVSLKRQGSTEDYKACCPFHHEKTPSFLVHDDKGFYKCFGCGKSGNLFTFIMEMEHIGFAEAVEELAERANVELKKETEKEKNEYSKQKALSDMYNRICSSFHYILLNNPNAEKARAYIRKRGILPEICDKFMLGYAFENTSWLYNFLKSKNYSDELIKDSGLFSKNYDKFPLFRNRILFPVRNWQGNCVAFSGRDLSNAPNSPKYINSPDTVIYNKKNVLFGFYESLADIKKNDEIILCEGNFDVISLHQAGICNSCAPLGTAFTAEQAALIKRYCKRVKLLFDSDVAGVNATKKAIYICQKYDLECYVIKQFQNAKDASQVLEEQGAEKLRISVGNVENAFSYLVNSAVKMYDVKSPKGKLSVFKEVIPYLDVTSSTIERQEYIKYLSEQLHIKEDEIVKDYGNKRHIEADKNDKTRDEFAVKTPAITAELDALLLIISNRDYFGLFKKHIKINYLDDENARKIYIILEDSERENVLSDDAVFNRVEDETLRNLVFSSLGEKRKIQNPESAVNDAIKSLKFNFLVKKRNSVIKLIESEDSDAITLQERRNLLEAKTNLDKEIEELKTTEDKFY